MVSYLIFCFVCFLIPFITMPLLLNTKTKSAKKDSSNPSPGSTGQLGNSTFGGDGQGNPCPDSDNYSCHWNFFHFFPQYTKIETPKDGTIYSDTVVDQKFWASKVTDFSISKEMGQVKEHVTPTVENIMSDGFLRGFVVRAARHGTKAVAQSFMSKTKNKTYGLIHYLGWFEGYHIPEYMNFHVTVDLSYFIRYHWGDVNGTIKDVTFGQGSSNDWWIISPNCDWHQIPGDRTPFHPGGRWSFHCNAHNTGSNRKLSIFFVPVENNLYGKTNEVMVCREGVNCAFPFPTKHTIDVPPLTATCGDQQCNPPSHHPTSHP